MRGRILLIGVAVLASLVVMGCDQVTQGQTNYQAGEWATYTSPDKHVSFDYPSSLKLTVQPLSDTDDPGLALSMDSPDKSLGMTLMLRLSVEELPGFCEQRINLRPVANTRDLTRCEPISLGEGQGLRQEFRAGSGWKATEYIAVALAAEPAYVHFACVYKVQDKQELRPICERIVDSLKLQNP